MMGLVLYCVYFFYILIVSKICGMGIGSLVISFCVNDGNCECFLLEWYGIGEILSY